MDRDNSLIGPYGGQVAPEYREASLMTALLDLPQQLNGAPLGAGLRADIHRVELPHGDQGITVAVKSFRQPNRLRSLWARRVGSKASRSFNMARALQAQGIGTPAAVAYLEHWNGSVLADSYFLTLWQEGLHSLREELIRLYHQAPYYDRISALLETVAKTIRAMHDAGIQHGDLGNQNILLRRVGEAEWADVRLIDLNRGRIRDRTLTLHQRGRDLSRLSLPTHIRYLFHQKYVGAGKSTRHLRRAERPHVWMFRIHDWSRPIRHPLRERRVRRELARIGAPTYPAPRDYWIWDPQGAQPIGALHVKERLFYRHPMNTVVELGATAAWLLPCWVAYRKARRQVYKPGSPVAGCVGMTVHPTPAHADRERELLRRLGPVPVLLRFYHHQSAKEWAFNARFLRQLHNDGHSVAAAFVQDRRAIQQPQRWDRFVETVFDAVGDILEWAEVGHAVNRVKWGIWRLSEYRRLAKPFVALRQRYPQVKLMGPAINDFEYHHLAAALTTLPTGLHFDALSLHLYVDRRGPPENTQYGLDTTDKFAMARGMARLARRCSDRVIISEVNWWLSDHNFVDYVSQDEYANYMLRYYVMAIASGMVERVYWWRLIARDFGLVDDATEPWRLRPAYFMLEAFLTILSDAEFIERHTPARGAFVYRFRKADGTHVGFAYALQEYQVELPFSWHSEKDAFGELTHSPGPTIQLGPRPKYLLDLGDE